MALSDEITNKLKVLINVDQDFEAIKLLKKESELSYDEATEYVHRLKDSLGKDASKPVKTNSRLMLFVFAGLSGLFWILAVVFYISKSNQIERSILIEGVVIEMIIDEEGSAPVVSYQVDETEYKYQSTIYSTPPAYEIGEVVELYVNENNPEETMINNFIDRWLVILILVILGVAFDIAAVLALKMKPTSVDSSISFFEQDDRGLDHE